MSVEANKAIIRRFIDAVNRRHLEEVWGFFDPSCILSLLNKFGLFPTLDGYKPFITFYLEAFPDAQFTIEDMVAEEGKVWIRLHMEGTHQGVLHNIPPSGKKVHYSRIEMYRIADGKIVQMDVYGDELSLLKQQLDQEGPLQFGTPSLS